MTFILRGGDRRTFVDCSEHDGDVDRAARHLAGEDAATSDAHVEALVTDAVHRWRIDDAIYWQRVMFKARLERARLERARLERARLERVRRAGAGRPGGTDGGAEC